MTAVSRTLSTAATLVAATLAASPTPLRAQTPAVATSPSPLVVEVVAEDYAFDAPAAIPSGWTTIRFRNAGQESHMILLTRLPEGKTIEDYERDLSSLFSRAWEAVRDDGVAQDQALGMIFGSLPEWFPQVQFVGGPGLAAPGRASEVTMELEPGNYVLECYMKTEDGKIHYMEGMIRPLVVTEARSDAAPPSADIRITLSNTGLEIGGNLTPGRRTVAVHAAENPEQGFGHSVHLARLNPGVEVDDVVRWMNWFDLRGLRTPAPAEFVGGLHPLPTGKTAYFAVNLEPGRYLAVSEATGAQGVLKEFAVQ